jgi:tetratricopeptide (TPR) repeat protein
LRTYAGGRYERAIEEFRKTIAIDPSHARAYNKLGSVYFNLGMLDEARGYQERALALDPDFEGAHYELALVFKKLGDMEKARHHWKEYLRIEPAGFFAAKAEEEIKSSYGKH